MNEYPVFDTSRCPVPGLQSVMGWHLVEDCNVPTAPPPIFSCDPVIDIQPPPSYLGIQGFQGVPGPPGGSYQGYQGFQGFQGLQGYQGFQGFQGLQGYQGFQGFQGYQGYQGFQGYQGEAGVPGPPGPPGTSNDQYYAVAPHLIARATGLPPSGVPTPFTTDVYTIVGGSYSLYEADAQCFNVAPTDIKAGKGLVLGRHDDSTYGIRSEFC